MFQKPCCIFASRTPNSHSRNQMRKVIMIQALKSIQSLTSKGDWLYRYCTGAIRHVLYSKRARVQYSAGQYSTANEDGTKTVRRITIYSTLRRYCAIVTVLYCTYCTVLTVLYCSRPQFPHDSLQTVTAVLAHLRQGPFIPQLSNKQLVRLSTQ